MKTLKLTVLAAICAGACVSNANPLMAQDIVFRDAPPPPGMHGRMASTMDELRFELEIRDSAHWVEVSGKIQGVLNARQALAVDFGGRPRGGPRDAARADLVSFGPQARAELALFSAILNNETADRIAAATDAVHLASRAQEKQNEVAYEKAQEDLRAVLNARQQAQLTLFGILK
jgi:hypothetical protein